MKKSINQGIAASLLCVAGSFLHIAHAQSQDDLGASTTKYQPIMKQIAQTMWESPELGFLEYDSSALMQKMLKNRGFTVKKVSPVCLPHL